MALSVLNFLLGRPLRTNEQEERKIGPGHGIPVLGLDALSSAAYGPEAALTVLLALGAGAVHYIGPISAVIIVLLLIVFVSYRQTIGAYPNGGGAYIVASENLGRLPGLLAASALSLDYILNVAVGIAAGVGAIVSALPPLLPHTLALCLGMLALIMFVNLRGVRESGLLFMAPTYLFVTCLGIVIVWGVVQAIRAHGAPVPITPPPKAVRVTEGVSAWLLLRAFASGCTAMTGVEAVSNGVPIFQVPTVKTAERTLTMIIIILAVLLAGIAYLSPIYGIVATPPGVVGYESVLSQLVGAVMGRGPFYYVTLTAVVAVLCLSANTSFADFPRLCRLLALDAFLPAEFAHLGRRLVYTGGILILAILAAILLIAFGGITDRLIPLFAVGAFLSFTLSQAGMVMHWRRVGGPRATRAALVNGIGATATGITLLTIVVAKFTAGAWIVLLVIPGFMALYLVIRRDYDRVEAATSRVTPLPSMPLTPPIVVIPIQHLDRVAQKSIEFALSISPEVEVVHIIAEDTTGKDTPGKDTPEKDTPSTAIRAQWDALVVHPLTQAGHPAPRLVMLPSTYREFLEPLFRHIQAVVRDHPGRYVAVVVPEFIERRWYHFFLHSHRPTLLKAFLLLEGGPSIVVINAPWYLKA